MEIVVNSMRWEYKSILNQIRERGHTVSPRGQLTRELIGTTLAMNPIDAYPVGIGRGLSAGVAAFEALQLIGNFSDPEALVRISPNFAQFMDDGRFHGAYGVRAGWQFDSVLRKLRSDADSRQALVTLWDPVLDNQSGKHDYPCTTSLHFLIREDRLILHTHMRSNDAWLGLPYDAFQFTQLQLTMAHMLGIEAGVYYHHTTSLHLYARDFDKVDDLLKVPESLPPVANGLDHRLTWAGMRKLARYLASAVDGPGTVPNGASEAWYVDALSPHQLK